MCDNHQLEEIRSITHNVSAIQGPPGTGKTCVIANILEHAVELGAVSRRYTLSALTSMPREYAEAVRLLANAVVPGRAKEGRGNSRLVVSARKYCVSSAMLHLAVAWRAHAEEALLSRTTVFLSTIDRAHTVHHLLCERKRALKVIIVDEAGAVPGWKMPILTGCGGTAAPELIILVGDQKQLPPLSRAKHVTPPRSELERMESALPKGSIKMLRTQYRMPPVICDFLSRRFYDSLLTTAPQKVLQSAQTPGPALVWRDHKCRESRTFEGTSYYNELEIDIIANLLTSSQLNAERLAANYETVMVIAYYSEQARQLQACLHTTCPYVSVMTVDAAQGSEADYAILSCVRCNDSRSIGHVADKRRVNVALSRARKNLIIVSSAHTLEGGGEVAGAGTGEENVADL